MRAASGLATFAACGIIAVAGLAWSGPASQVSHGDVQKALDSCPPGKVAGPDGVCVRDKSGRMGFDLAAPSDNDSPSASSGNSARSLKMSAQKSVDLQLSFAAGSAELSNQDKANARALAAMLMLPKYATVKVQIAGHTDKTESAAFNRNLSKRRADAVKGILVSLGVGADRIDTVGYGDTMLAKRVVIARRLD